MFASSYGLLMNPISFYFHYKLPCASDHRSFFSLLIEPSNERQPLDPTTHKPILLDPFLLRKLRWTTLGGQYDWTAKKYPAEKSPLFPSGVAELLETFFPEMRAEAAIVNVYTVSDVLSMYRDVAEDSGRGLASVSMGCDAIVVIGLGSDNDQATVSSVQATATEVKASLVVRVRPGDAVFMSGLSLLAWHGLPQIIPGTCPDFLKSWPAGEDGKSSEFEQWRG